ncbi:hypothetical protein MRX96_002160 [Rhipicephalus microplus]|uniref:Uncharacterized protein n=1 Tax=Rhipicephalus microplus TaxID=6941 RepID=A0A9J6F8B8_RHIMP|nr:hypothetical protein HPB51_020235 [Rhipicephalus microplus]
MGQGVIGLANHISTDHAVQRAVSPGNKVIGAQRFGTTNIVILTFEHADIPRNVLIFGEANHVQRYRKTVPTCSDSDKVSHRTDVCPNPTTLSSQCPTCGNTDVDLANHDCLACCLLCNGPQITGARECPKRYRSRVDTHPDQHHRHVGTHESKHSRTKTGPTHDHNDAAPTLATQLEGLIVLHPDLNIDPSLGTNNGPDHGPVQDANGLYSEKPPRKLGAAVRVHAR